MSSISVPRSLPTLWLLSKVPGALEHKVALAVQHFSPHRFSNALADIQNRSLALEARHRAGRISCPTYARRAARLDRLRFALYRPYAGPGPRHAGLRVARYQWRLGGTRAKVGRALAEHPGTPRHSLSSLKAAQSIAARQADLARAWCSGTLPKRNLYERIVELAALKRELHGWPASRDQTTRESIFHVVTALAGASTGALPTAAGEALARASAPQAISANAEMTASLPGAA